MRAVTALVGVWLCLMSVSLHADTLRVAVASNFRPAMALLKTSFESNHPAHVSISYGASGKLVAKAIHGAPYDVVLLADEKRASTLYQRFSNAQATPPFVYAIGMLALISRSPIATDVSTYLRQECQSSKHSIAIANPRIAPYGEAAIEYLEQVVEPNVTLNQLLVAENVQQALLFTDAGGASVSIVSLSLAKMYERSHQLYVFPINNDFHRPIKQAGVALNQRKVTREFVAYLRSPEGQNIIKQAGYNLP
ncbi:molybdate ABC transporter substrate-binding protein [Aestuariibacter sp. AA17]|uniref:Molybdate ABC transporter substrate-binding protein n=1 Tax=Fluctibacter corallii TaxID=2984329 RepID=A0ABT3A5J6_9ALTE|nr:molybdate ABC transporter substrate-binding protein [Aestuariibacter sp. AA17]MCV2883913.1 molybdate ABC transporter substrate-binding protein [Aestuariibacter sp. AA17]